MEKLFIRLSGANMDIDLTSEDKINWKQSKCPWNEEENTATHKCAIKNTSICEYFYGVEHLDTVLCKYITRNTR